MKCKKCGKELKPAPAKWDGEPTSVGFLPCDCKDNPYLLYGDKLDRAVQRRKEEYKN